MTIRRYRIPPSEDCGDDRTDNVVPLRTEPRPTSRRPEPEPLWRQVVGDQLRAERTARGERIADVALRAGVAPQYLSELERGVKDGSSEILAAVTGALGLSVLEIARRASLHPVRSRFRRSDGPVCLAA